MRCVGSGSPSIGRCCSCFWNGWIRWTGRASNCPNGRPRPKLAALSRRRESGSPVYPASDPDSTVDHRRGGEPTPGLSTPPRSASWAGKIRGRQESAEHNHSSRSPKGNKFLRRILTQAAQAAVKKKGSHFQTVFRRWIPKLGYPAAIWAIAHKLARLVWKILHDQVHYLERGQESDPAIKRRRANKMIRALRSMGYQVQIQPAQG